MVFRAAERKDGVLLASRILKAINSEEFDLGNNRKLARSCSVGWAAFPWLNPACSDLSVDEVLRLADRGLYSAKQQGRNRAVGLVPSVKAPALNASDANASASALNSSGKYCSVEQLLADNLIDEVQTSGETATTRELKEQLRCDYFSFYRMRPESNQSRRQFFFRNRRRLRWVEAVGSMSSYFSTLIEPSTSSTASAASL